jgi:hypothetical protein
LNGGRALLSLVQASNFTPKQQDITREVAPQSLRVVDKGAKIPVDPDLPGGGSQISLYS